MIGLPAEVRLNFSLFSTTLIFSLFTPMSADLISEHISKITLYNLDLAIHLIETYKHTHLILSTWDFRKINHNIHNQPCSKLINVERCSRWPHTIFFRQNQLKLLLGKGLKKANAFLEPLVSLFIPGTYPPP